MRNLLFLIALIAADGPASRWSRAEYSGVFTDPSLTEVSGLAASHVHPGIYWAHNDGDNGSMLIAIRADGTPAATLVVQGAENTDWEDIDSFELDGKHYLMVADTGDNGGIRKTLNLVVFEEPSRLKDGDTIRPAWTIPFRWPDGARDCEATAVDAAAGEVLLISKKRVPPELFRLPLRAAEGLKTAELVTTLSGVSQPSEAELKKNPVYGRYRSQVSGADLSPNGRVLAVLNYHSIYLYVRTPGQGWAQAMQARPDRLVFPWLPQAEGIAFSVDGRSLLVASEKRPAPLLIFRIVK
ncbi:MAG: hypothetical protein NT117_09190 [Gammaproteobacteria bacterium]|nr:hypothetical protein [Gammaproteobacteria bacterium]